MSTLRIGVITDAHGNLPTLRAALAALDDEGIDVLYHTGDLIGIGPYPAECVDLLIRRPRTRLLMGNHDEWFAFGLPSPRPAWMSEGEWAHHRWTHAQLDPSLRAEVAAWPYAETVRHDGVEIELLHYPRDPSTGTFLGPADLDDPAVRERMFGRRNVASVFFGHDHRRWDVGGAPRLVSPGALGCSPMPEARFAVVEIGEERCDIHLRAVPYDPARLLGAFDAREVPERDFIRRAFMPRSQTED